MVSIRFQILFHSPRRGAFHLSLTVLVPYRCVRVFSLGGWSPRFHAACRVRGVTQAVCPPPSPSGTGLSPALVGLPRPFPFVRGDCCKPLLPRPLEAGGLGCSAFARHYWPNCSLFLALLRCFSSRGSLILADVIPFQRDRVSPFGHRRLPRLHTAHRRFSQCTTSFLGTDAPGIPRMLFSGLSHVIRRP